ncbi:hypothetical protein TTHERM_00125359 (macronuclear) [Tetrahymena thermophila SB210]|uniref:Uncharacterized protein n=1 Tax=Tetrahymena thermophila (strain SB210) TaxID=312017 RepID=A4VDU8_TETTS|nr:hypothetical protein TTHERM_00125359 [Tetrahymena thermophila SB210]EDK31714.2 hypothetical protein TTHERM_00125359 [Tetrahymena thermophila SB210]|eukprot:XP_001470806.2 hypothetical protein TTHERM_00125359 [Tetrahymena thermophila SB210]
MNFLRAVFKSIKPILKRYYDKFSYFDQTFVRDFKRKRERQIIYCNDSTLLQVFKKLKEKFQVGLDEDWFIRRYQNLKRFKKEKKNSKDKFNEYNYRFIKECNQNQCNEQILQFISFDELEKNSISYDNYLQKCKIILILIQKQESESSSNWSQAIIKYIKHLQKLNIQIQFSFYAYSDSQIDQWILGNIYQVFEFNFFVFLEDQKSICIRKNHIMKIIQHEQNFSKIINFCLNTPVKQLKICTQENFQLDSQKVSLIIQHNQQIQKVICNKQKLSKKVFREMKIIHLQPIFFHLLISEYMINNPKQVLWDLYLE